MKDKREVILQAVRDLKNSEFKATGIKIELEADLAREDDNKEMVDAVLDYVANKLNMVRHPDAVEYGEDDHDFASANNPLPGVVYIRGYNDGSVDSEITFTISLEEVENIELIPLFIEAWDAYCMKQEIYEVSGAGMHMALLNSRNCIYPSRISDDDENRFMNFRKSMFGLLPALYFLAAHNWSTRGMEYRQPRMDICDAAHGYSKFNAISYSRGAVEFRVFDTCYDNPGAALDNVVVMRNCMKFWSSTYKPSGMAKIAKEIRFGNDESRNLARLYNTAEHIDLLNAGIAKLKPCYVTIRELKRERDFTVTKRTFNGVKKKYYKQAEKMYEEYIERRTWEEMVRKWQHIGYYVSCSQQGMSEEEALRLATEKAEAEMQDAIKRRLSKSRFLEQTIQSLAGYVENSYSLEVA